MHTRTHPPVLLRKIYRAPHGLKVSKVSSAPKIQVGAVPRTPNRATLQEISTRLQPTNMLSQVVIGVALVQQLVAIVLSVFMMILPPALILTP